MSAPPRLTRDLLAVHEGTAAGYASERDRSEAGSEAGDIEPSSRLAGQAHDPYARSSATFRGALHGLGIDPSKPNPRSRLQLQSGGGGNAAAAAAGARAASAGSAGAGPRPSSDRFGSLSAWDRHKQLAADYARYYSSPAGSAAAAAAAAAPQKTDADVLRENHLFVRTPADDAAALRDQDKRMALSYYNQLFKEYALGDLTRYKTGEVGLRWRTEAEVLSGKGHFSCGSKHCQATEGLTSFEVNFGYVENGAHKQALVKLRLCVDCGLKLHYKKLREMEAVQREAKREHAKREEAEAAERKARKKKERKREKKEAKQAARESSSSSSRLSKKHSKQSGDKRRRSHSPSDSSASSSDDEVTVVSSSSHNKAAKTDSSSSATAGRTHASPASEAAFAVPAPQMSRHDPRYDAPLPAVASASSASTGAESSSLVPAVTAAAAASERAPVHDFIFP